MLPKKIFAIFFSITISLFLSGCTSNNNQENTNNVDWLLDYSPVHPLGTEKDDFWIVYPTGHPNSSETPIHLPWIKDSLNEGCVLFVVHKTGCESCTPQAERTIRLAENYEEYIEFFDLDIPLGGSIEEKAYESYLYDPDGPTGIIALTGIITIFNNSGKIEYGWHSWEQDVTYSEMEGWLKDGIYYWLQNSGELR
jgi:hypothetical protein